jgi:glycerol dehydrogenase-like iron-containing ADH family enzyme
MRQPFLHGAIISLGVVLMTILQERDPLEIVDFLDRAGVPWRPEQVGLQDEQIMGAIETLYEFCMKENFYYTVIHQQKPDRQTGLGLISHLRRI